MNCESSGLKTGRRYFKGNFGLHGLAVGTHGERGARAYNMIWLAQPRLGAGAELVVRGKSTREAETFFSI